jgi:hypothetical protein
VLQYALRRKKMYPQNVTCGDVNPRHGLSSVTAR